jgi:cell division protein FtsN
MREPNARVRPREKFQLSLDGRQVASVVTGALVVLAVVFVLGLNVGKQLAVRHAEAGRAGDLEALDRAPARAPAHPEPLTFHDRLTKESPAQPPPPPEAPAKLVAAAPAAAEPLAPEPSTPAPASVPTPAPATLASATPAAARPAPAVPAPTPATKPWTVQLAAAADRAEADRLAGKFASLNARVEEATVPGKGRFYRVRVGSFETKEAAQRYLRDVGRETGAKGIVVPSR